MERAVGAVGCLQGEPVPENEVGRRTSPAGTGRRLRKNASARPMWGALQRCLPLKLPVSISDQQPKRRVEIAWSDCRCCRYLIRDFRTRPAYRKLGDCGNPFLTAGSFAPSGLERILDTTPQGGTWREFALGYCLSGFQPLSERMSNEAGKSGMMEPSGMPNCVWSVELESICHRNLHFER